MLHRGWQLVALAAIAATVAVPATLAAPTRPARPTAALSSLESGVLADVNRLRRQHGLVPLHLSAQLSAAARQHSRSMAVKGYFSHDSANGSVFWRRIKHYYGPNGYHFWSVGENLLWSSPDVDANRALQLWLASPPHRKNMLTAEWREIGISAVHEDAGPGTFGGQPVTIITTDFGVRR